MTNLFDKIFVADECQRLYEEGFSILDTETTGLEENARIVEVTLLSHFGDVLFHSLVNPGHPIDPEATELHGITDDMVKDAPRWEDLKSDMAKAVDSSICNLVIYNDQFDMNMMQQSGGDPFQGSMTTFCAMRAFAMFNGELKDNGNYTWKKLADAAEQTGFVMPEGMQAHRATADCIMTLHLMQIMAGWVWQPNEMEVSQAIEQVDDTASAMTLAEALWPGRYLSLMLSVVKNYDGEQTQECLLSVYERGNEKKYNANAPYWHMALRAVYEQAKGRPAITY